MINKYEAGELAHIYYIYIFIALGESVSMQVLGGESSVVTKGKICKNQKGFLKKKTIPTLIIVICACPTPLSFGSLIRTPLYKFLPHSRCLQNCFSFGFEDYILEAACVEERASYIYTRTTRLIQHSLQPTQKYNCFFFNLF